jgi:hypothetical protein
MHEYVFIYFLLYSYYFIYFIFYKTIREITEGEHIVTVAKGIHGISVANIEILKEKKTNFTWDTKLV